MRTDTGNAERLIAGFGDRIRYCPPMKSWLVWTGTHWALDDAGQVLELCKLTARQMLVEAAGIENDAERTQLTKWALNSESANRLAAMEKLARTIPSVVVSMTDLDRDGWALNVLNGTLDLRTGDLREHNPADLITRVAPVEWNPDAEAPTWAGFLDWAMCGDAELVSYLQRAAGYSLTGDTSERVFHLLHGAGRNGKSTFIEALRDVLGPYATRVATASLMKQKHASGGGAASGDIARLKGARFVTANEGEDGQELAEARIKDLVGGRDTITARFLYRDEFEFRPEFKLWFSTNHLPEVSTSDQAIWDRMRLIPFLARISDEEMDGHLGEKLAAEASGILRWAVEGCLAWQRDGLKPTAAMEVSGIEYHHDQDHIGQFVMDRCVLGDEEDEETGRSEPYEVTKAALFDAYTLWCSNNRVEHVSSKAFTRELSRRHQDLTERRGAKGVRSWRGIGLRQEDSFQRKPY